MPSALAGDDPVTAASRAGVFLAERYLVLALHLGDEHHEQTVNPVITRHRRANAVQPRVARPARTPSMTSWSNTS